MEEPSGRRNRVKIAPSSPTVCLLEVPISHVLFESPFDHHHLISSLIARDTLGQHDS
jgi:hypothetical protein